MIETGINPVAAAYNRNNSLDNNWFTDHRRGSVQHQQHQQHQQHRHQPNGYEGGGGGGDHRRGLSPDRGMKLLDTGARRLYESSDR